MYPNNQAFTLVELIVTIAILAILWTIAFISLQWYSEQSRDSTRISDISTIKTSLELFQLESWKYPLPTSWVDITFSWAVVWNQWTFWESVYKNVSKLDKIPTDPLTNSVYTYSVTQKRNEYELAWVVETDWFAYNSNLPLRESLESKSNAWNNEAIAIVTWNYNWEMAKTNSWSICDILSTPTIVSSDIVTSTDLEQISINKRFVFNWYKNLPSSYVGSKFKMDGWFNFEPTKLLSYRWDCSSLETSITERIKALKWLQESYSWSIISWDGNIIRILSLDLWKINQPEWTWTVTIWNSASVSVNTVGWVTIWWGWVFLTTSTTPTARSTWWWEIVWITWWSSILVSGTWTLITTPWGWEVSVLAWTTITISANGVVTVPWWIINIAWIWIVWWWSVVITASVSWWMTIMLWWSNIYWWWILTTWIWWQVLVSSTIIPSNLTEINNLFTWVVPVNNTMSLLSVPQTCWVKYFKIWIDITEDTLVKYHNQWNSPDTNIRKWSRISVANRYCGKNWCTADTGNCLWNYPWLWYNWWGTYLESTNEIMCVWWSDIQDWEVRIINVWWNVWDIPVTDLACKTECTNNWFDNWVSVERLSPEVACSCRDNCWKTNVVWLDTSWCAYGSTSFTNSLWWTNTELKYDSWTNKCYVFWDENTNAINACNKWVTDNATLWWSWIWVPARNFVTDWNWTNLKDSFYQREVVYNGNTYVCRWFAAMKYEAKFTSTSWKIQPNPTDWATWAVSDYVTDNDTFSETVDSWITSKAWDYPIAFIRQWEAIWACKWSTNNQYHLITNNEWMAVARNIEAQTVNLKDWNKLYRWLNWWSWINWEDWVLWCGKTWWQTTYYTSPAWTDNNSLSSTRTSCNDKRQNKLSNWALVWDLSWNVREHVNKSNVPNTSNVRTSNSGWNTNLYSTEAMCSNASWFAWKWWYGTDTLGIWACSMIWWYSQASYGPLNNWNANNWVWRIYASNVESIDNTFLRGDCGAGGFYSGIFMLNSSSDASTQGNLVGFRCAW